MGPVSLNASKSRSGGGIKENVFRVLDDARRTREGAGNEGERKD